MLIGLHRRVHVWEFIKERRLCVRSYFPQQGTSGSVMVSKLDWQTCKSEFESHWVPHSIGLVPHRSKELRKLHFPQHVLFVSLGIFVRWEVSDQTTTVLCDVASSRICLKEQVAFYMHFVSFQGVHLYSSICTATAWEKTLFILSDWSNFLMINNMSMAVHAFSRRMMSSLSVDKILLSRYMNKSNNFRGLPLKIEIALFFFKNHELLFAFPYKSISPATCSGLWSRDSAWSTRSSA